MAGSGARSDGVPERHRLHRALASPVRGRILEDLRAADGPQSVAALATRHGLHVNTIRAHLAVLEEAGLVTAAREEPAGPARPGRPRLVYRAADAPSPDLESAGPAPPAADEHGYRFLAEVLASYLEAHVEDSVIAAEQAGSAWGRHLVERPGPFRTLKPAEVLDRLRKLMDALGFAPQLDNGPDSTTHLQLRRCPFLEVAREHQQVVCGVHLGLLRGAVAELGGDVEVRQLRPFATPDRCIADLGRPA